MRSFFKFWPAIFILALFPRLGIAGDTLKIHLTYKHKLDDAGRSQGYITINQKFYTPDLVLFREINFDEQNSQIASYIFYFYSGNKLMSEECYNQKDSLMYILKHQYDVKGREDQVSRYEPVHGSLQVIRNTVKSYDKAGHIVKEKVYNGKKLGIVILYSYNNAGLIDRENRKFKPSVNQTLKSEMRSYLYNADNSLKQVLILEKDASNNAVQKSEDYSYNDKRQLSMLKISGPGNSTAILKTYKYLDSGNLSFCQESDPGGKVYSLLQYDYKKHYMDKGSQVSYFAR